MKARQLYRFAFLFIFVFVTAPLTSRAAVPDEVTNFARKISKSPAETCKAILNIELKKVSRIAACEKGRSIKEIKGKDCDTAKKGHYTLYDKVCQCNDSEHSELHVLDDKPRIKAMTNFANPCVHCYIQIVKHMIDNGRLDKGESLTIEYKETRDRASLTQHERLTAACVQYKRDDPDDFK